MDEREVIRVHAFADVVVEANEVERFFRIDEAFALSKGRASSGSVPDLRSSPRAISDGKFDDTAKNESELSKTEAGVPTISDASFTRVSRAAPRLTRAVSSRILSLQRCSSRNSAENSSKFAVQSASDFISARNGFPWNGLSGSST